MKNKYYDLKENLNEGETAIFFTYPLSISSYVYNHLDSTLVELGWIYNWKSESYIHHFFSKEERNAFIEIIKRWLDERES